MKKIKFENLEKKNPEIRHLPTNHPYTAVGSSLLGSVQQSSSVRGKSHTTRVLYDVLNSVIVFNDEKVSYAHVTDLY